MRTIHADLALRTRSQCIRFPSTRQLRELCVRAGDRVRLCDGAVEVEAQVVLEAGVPVARPSWDTLTYTDDDDDDDDDT